MHVRRAGPKDLPELLALARRIGLDYPGMERDALWAADEAGTIVGLVSLKRHPDCLELCALGVDPAHRGRGIAKALVEALWSTAPSDVHLATVIPGFFKGRGFVRAHDIPETFIEKRRTSWCEGCDQTSCVVMVKRKT
jgi:N-acetylglutamate synthase-like GNAT family acetyltransferase